MALDRRTFMTGSAKSAVAAGVLGAAFLKDMNNGAKAQGAAIPIGSMLPLTGAAASDGIGGQYGFELAIEEINAMGGILGRPLEPHIVDTKNMSAEDAVSAANLLIERDGVHAIACVYNIGPNNAEYEPIADAGIIYLHVNTSIQHQQTVMKDPARYFGCFMFCPPETYYGTNLPVVLDRIRKSGAWTPDNNKIAIAVGSLPYSIVIAQKIKEAAPDYGFEVVFDEVVPTPTTEWGAVLDKMRALKPAVIANTHFFAGDLANFQRQFFANPTKSLVYLQYGALLKAFSDVARDAAVGVLTSSMISVIPDQRGNAFIAKMKERHGEDVNYDPAAYAYSEVYQYAIAASIAGGTGEPGNYDQNRKIAAALKSFPFRSVCGAVAYHPEWQCSVPYPAVEKDPSLGLPSPTYQIKSADGDKQMIFPDPYANSSFETPSWF